MAEQVTIKDDVLNTKVARVVHKNSIPDIPSLSVCTVRHTTTFTGDYAGAQAAVAIITPTSGYKICIHCVYTSTDQNVVDTELNFATSGICVHKLYVSQQQKSSAVSMNIRGATNEVLSFTCGAKTFVAVCYSQCAGNSTS